MTDRPVPPSEPSKDKADRAPASPAASSQKPEPTAIARGPRPAKASVAQRELDILIRARYPIIYVVTWEEERVEHCLREIAAARRKNLYTWTVTQGIVKSGAEPQPTRSSAGNTTDPIAGLDAVIQQIEPAIYMFKDFHHFTEDTRCNLTVLRRLRDVSCHLRDTYKTIVITSPTMRVAPEISKDITVIEFGLPGPEEFGALLDRITNDVRDNPKVKINLAGDARERLLRAARGLTLKEAENVFAKTLVTDGKLDANDVGIVFSEKQQVIKKSGLLEYYEASESLTDVAGLDNLKEWLKKRAIGFNDSAKQFGLPAPRGVLFLGVQGCGKSLCAKAISSLWGLPLLRFDLGRMFSSLVGSSEENIRRAIQIAESVAPAILWIDELDKALAGATGSAGSDGGTSARVFGTLLTWLSEKSAPVFVVATANDIRQLPPELLRKGRLDEIFFVDLPTPAEREEIIRIHLQKRRRNPADFDLAELARVAEGFNGAEIEEAIVSALFDAFSRGVDLSTPIVRNALSESVPLSKTMSEDLQRLRSWAAGRARPASSSSLEPAASTRRKIEL